MFDRIAGATASIFQPAYWEERLLRLLMGDEWLKVQAFRFVDVLPAVIDDPREIARHLREYFQAPSASAPAISDQQRALAELEGRRGGSLRRWVQKNLAFEHLDDLVPRLWARLARTSAIQMARKFIAGTTVEEAVRTIRRMRGQRLAFTIDVLGETALSSAEADDYHRIYLDLIARLPNHAADWPVVPQIDQADGQPLPCVNVSVKLTSIFAKCDPIATEAVKQACKERLRPLLRAAMTRGAHVHIDMEHYAIKSLTLAVFRELLMEAEFRAYPHFGIVLQAYLKDCEADAAALIEWAGQRGAPVWVRLVKGAYWDSETMQAAYRHWPCPVWQQKWQSDACYERVAALLLRNWRRTHLAAASHNIRSLAYAMALRERLDVPGTAFELQMLYGMGDPIKRAAVAMGQRVRVYTPYGQLLPGMAYLIRRLLENTANESFLRQSSGEVPAERLLEDPHETGRRGPAPESTALLRFEFEEPLMDPFENTPDTDFSLESSRAAMRSALEETRRGLGREIPLVIGGEQLAGDGWFETRNPSRPSEIVARVAEADRTLVDRAVKSAAAALRHWRLESPRQRAACLRRAATLLRESRHRLAALLSLECAKPWREADSEVSESVDLCGFYAQAMERMADHARRRDMPGETNEYSYSPRGVVAAITPWSAPLAIPAGTTAAALVTGNTVVLKPARSASAVSFELWKILREAGVPADVVQFVPGPGSRVGDALVRHPQVAMIAFSGSPTVGRAVHRLAAEYPADQPGFKHVLAQMGGKNAIIIDVDADLDEAIKAVLTSAFGCAGQKCSAASRCIVLEGGYERFVRRLVEAARSLTVGPADEAGSAIPPVIDRQAWQFIRAHIEAGKREARCELEIDVSELIARSRGGDGESGYYIGPTIFSDVRPDARMAQEEIFGPVLALIRARDIEHAIELFNGTSFALTGGIFSRSPANIERARAECECGNFFINRRITGALVDLQPFGGFKFSGTGAPAGGPDYLIQFCAPRCVTENTMRRGFAPSDELLLSAR